MPVHAFVFPGQGSQTVGMGRALAESFASAREVFEEVDDTLEQKLSRLMFEGPAEELMLTENAQPALMAMSLAVLRVLERDGGIVVKERAALLAGHSLGEYSALAAGGGLAVSETARLLRLRGDAMQKAVPPGLGAMAALIGVELAQVQAYCAEASAAEIVQPANDNGGGQVVISGHRTAVERAVEVAKANGVRRAMLLPVSAPFHCALMQPAADAMAEALAAADMRGPAVPLVSNVSAVKAVEPGAIRDLLVQQVTATVRWRESVEYMVSLGVDSFVEIGAGKVLTGLVRRIAPDARGLAVGGPEDIEALLKAL